MPVASIEPKDALKVWDCRALQRKGSTEAMALLHRISQQVQPVMRKRRWTVPLLSEFSPKNPNLLGLNINGGGGQTSEIKIRLRPHGSESTFFPYESLVGTMLHELVHNVQGPHNAVFYKLLDEITEECEGFMAKGIVGNGTGFDAPSVGRLGGRGPVPTHNPPAHQMKSAALKAAEARAKAQSLMTAGGRKLGGDLSMLKNLTPAQAAAKAAERRARDNVWCPCGDHGTDVQYTDGQVLPTAQGQSSDTTAAIQLGLNKQLQSKSGLVANGKPTHVPTMLPVVTDGAHCRSNSSLPCTAGATQDRNRSKTHSVCSATDRHSQPKPATAELVDLTLDDMNDVPVQLSSCTVPSKRARHDSCHIYSNPLVSRGFMGNSVQVSVSQSNVIQPIEAGVVSGKSTQPSMEAAIETQANRSAPVAKQESANQASSQINRDLMQRHPPKQWTCGFCTFASNPAWAVQCMVCGTPQEGIASKPVHLAAQHVHGPQSFNGWTCKSCTLVNSPEATHCSVCDSWRYSYGVPHASRPTL